MKGRSIHLLLLLLLVAGCAGRDAAEDPVQESEEDVTQRYEDFPPAEPQRCVSARRIRKVQPVGNHSLLFYYQNGEVWRSRLRSRCIALRSDVVISYDVRSASLCAGDIVDLLDRLGIGNQFSRVGACTLGEFDYLTEEQAEAFSAYQ
ncbi:MAG: DUF6491 family protein [Pseudomonadales bacterium]|jgi:hypothetical protein|nr:DUF6491 family protein [Pseudomonadales bacterium]